MKKVLSLLMALMICLGVFVLFGTDTVKAADPTIVYSGTTVGGCPWRITSDRELIFGEEGHSYSIGPYRTVTGISTYGLSTTGYSNGAWAYYIARGYVDHVRFEGDVSLKGCYSAGGVGWLWDNRGQQEWEEIKSIDYTNATGAGSASYMAILQSAKNIKNFSTEKFTGLGVKNFAYMCAGARLDGVDLSDMDTSSGLYFDSCFGNTNQQGVTTCDYLDISGWDTHNALSMRNMFGYNLRSRTIVLGPQFTFKGNNIEDSKLWAILPTPPEKVTTGKWIPVDGRFEAYTPEELRDNWDSSMAGAWTWEIAPNSCLIRVDANGGFCYTSRIDCVDGNMNAKMPSSATYPGRWLMGWSLDPNATEPDYLPDQTYKIGVPGQTITLYAVWTPEGITRYRALHYQENLEGGYPRTATDTDVYYGEVGSSVTPPVKNYENFVIPEEKSISVSSNGYSYVQYYYERIRYSIRFDGNGATSGQMTNQAMVAGIGSVLKPNRYGKKASIFTGWNTAADGSGTSYTDGANVVDLIKENGSTVTLYAQWLENENPAMEPTNGAVRVTLKQGQTVVIPDLPAGTSYTIREVSNPSGWEWKSTDGETGTITANQTNDATVHNVYHAVGSIPFEIYKVLEDGLSGENKPIEAGKFTFALVDASEMRIMVASNEATDTDETIFNAAGEEVPNPNYGKALVSFDTIEYDESDIGKTYTYYISEINTPEGYEASEPVTVTVTIADAGQGQLDVTASYDHNQMITNIDRTGGFLEVKKFVSGSAPEGAEFTFKVDLSDESGKTYAESVAGVKSDDSTLNITSGETFTLKADESATFRLPAGITYKVSEQIGDGWTLVQSSGTEGSVNSGQTSTAIFTNAYNVEGIVEIPATKTLTGKELTANEFNFVLEDAESNVVAQATNDATGSITFSIPYTSEDVGQTYTYTAHEVIPDETFGVTYDETIYTVQVAVSAENGTLTGSVTIVDHDSMVWNNTYAASTDITVSGKKVLTGRDFRDTDKWTFTLDGDGPKPQDVSIEIYPAQGDSFSFTIPFSTADMEGQRTKEFTYTVTESGFVPLIANDKSTKTFTVRVTDDGEGVMKAELLNADDLDLTFTNRALVTLPMTGSMASIWIMLAGLLVITAGIMYSRKRRNDLAE